MNKRFHYRFTRLDGTTWHNELGAGTLSDDYVRDFVRAPARFNLGNRVLLDLPGLVVVALGRSYQFFLREDYLDAGSQSQ